MKKWRPRDCVTVIIVICASALIMSGRDSIIGLTLLGVVAGYYGINIVPWNYPKRGNNKRKNTSRGGQNG